MWQWPPTHASHRKQSVTGWNRTDTICFPDWDTVADKGLFCRGNSHIETVASLLNAWYTFCSICEVEEPISRPLLVLSRLLYCPYPLLQKKTQISGSTNRSGVRASFSYPLTNNLSSRDKKKVG